MLRYLKQGHLRLTRDALREREWLVRERAGLVERVGFLVALREGRWSVVGTRGGWITSGPRPPGRGRREDGRSASHPVTRSDWN